MALPLSPKSVATIRFAYSSRKEPMSTAFVQTFCGVVPPFPRHGVSEASNGPDHRHQLRIRNLARDLNELTREALAGGERRGDRAPPRGVHRR